MSDRTPPSVESSEPPVLANELARERNREAADRTLLAWIRTSLAMISLGFGIERLGQAASTVSAPPVTSGEPRLELVGHLTALLRAGGVEG